MSAGLIFVYTGAAENEQGGTDMSILGAVIVPHPPLIIPTVGRGQEQEVQATIDAYRTAAKQVAAWNPEVLMITSPHHWPVLCRHDEFG